MSIKRIFIVISAIFAASAVFADNSSVTSKKYVDYLMSGYQGKLPGAGANTLMIYDDETGIGEKSIETTLVSNATGVPTVGAVKDGLDDKQDTITGTAGYVMTGTGTPGEVGEKPIYSANTNYSEALVTAETVNTGVINAVNSSLIRVNEQGAPSDSGTLWEINTSLFALSTQPLPTGYTRLEYIESTGNSYINTGIKQVYQQKVSLEFSFTPTGLVGYFGGNAYTQYQVNSSFGFAVDTNNVAKVVYNGTGSTLYNNGSIVHNYATWPSGYSDVSVGLFALGMSNITFTNTAKGKLYYAKIWDENDELVRNFIPASKVENNTTVVGLYDTVTGTFFRNAGTGNFTAGPACVGPNLLSLNETKVLAAAIAVTKPTYAGVNQGATWTVGNNANISANAEGVVIPVTAGDKYSLRIFNSSAFGGQGRYTYAEMDSTGKVTKGNTAYSSTLSTGITITAENTGFLCIQFAVNTTDAAVANAQIMVVKGDVIPTEYRPYGENICD